MFLLMMSGFSRFEKMLLMSVSLPLRLSLVGSVIVDRNWFEESMFMNSEDGS